jgi:hypothetical protein
LTQVLIKHSATEAALLLGIQMALGILIPLSAPVGVSSKYLPGIFGELERVLRDERVQEEKQQHQDEKQRWLDEERCAE